MASLSCGGSCMKYILFLFNIVFFLCGAALLGVGIWAKVDDEFNNYIEIINFDDNNPYYEQTVWILIAVGAFIFLVGFLGCCGACQESSCMLNLYGFFLFLVIALQIAGATLAILFKDDLGSDFEQSMSTQANQDVTVDTNIPITAAWYSMQYNLKCCGGYNYTDYYDSTFQDVAGGLVVPLTCCKLSNSDPENAVPEDPDQCQAEAASGYEGSFDNLYTEGCYDALIDWVEANAYLLFGVALGIALIEILGIVFACCVSSEIKKGTYQ